MKQDWEVRKLGDVCQFENGDRGTNYPSKSHRTVTGIPFINAGHLTSNGLDLESMDYISRERFNLLGSGKVQKDDILFCLRGSLGKFAKVQEFSEGAIASSLVIVRPNQKIISGFLMSYFESQICADMIKDFGNGAAQPNLSAGSLKNFEIPLPPLPEQQRIVAILDEAFAAIAQAKANAEQNLKNAKELFESYLQSVFENKGEGWEEKSLKEVCAKITDGTHQTPKYFDDGVIFLSSKNVTSGKIDWNNIKYIDEKQHLEMHKRVAPKVGDILLAKNGTTGVAAMVDRDLVFDIYVSLAHIRVLDEVTPNFMLYFINSPAAKKQFNKRLKGIGVPNLHLEEIREVEISFPKSKDEQNILVQKLDALSTETKQLETIYQQKINDLDELKKSILQKAFAGELNTTALEV
jgi:type I restriction enzyme S subunit